MDRNNNTFHLLFLLLFSLIVTSTSTFNLPTTTFGQGYKPLFSDFNIIRSSDDRAVSLLLTRSSGSGFISSRYYGYGIFSASIKLPSNYSAGIVVAFYTSNGDVFQKTHDELDFEFLGNVRGKPWRFQTNLYGNGSTNRGREERYTLWFDPTKEFHRYTILWTSKQIIFYIDEVPIRQVIRSEAMRSDYPSKPMALYATIWDASKWATDGGKHSVNYKYQPFESEYKDLVLEGCPVDPKEQMPITKCNDIMSTLEAAEFNTITTFRRDAMDKFRQRYMYYSYCYDKVRYPVKLPECENVTSERHMFLETGRLKRAVKIRFANRNRRLRQRRPRPAPPEATADDM